MDQQPVRRMKRYAVGTFRITANGWFVEAVGLLDVGKDNPVTPPIDLTGEKKK